MAGTITASATLTIVNGSYRRTIAPGSLSVVQDAIGEHAPIISVGSGAEEDFSIGDISTLGYAFFHNLDTANYVTFGPKSGGVMVPMVRLEAGDYCFMRLEPGITLRGQANTAAVKLQMVLMEN